MKRYQIARTWSRIIPGGCSQVVERVGLTPTMAARHFRLLKAEGVVFLNGKVSVEQHGWKPGTASPLYH